MIAHIIHTSNRVDRLELIQKELAEQCIINYRLWEGEQHPTISFLGIGNSHRRIVAYAMEAKLPEVLIMENDVKFLGDGAFNYFVNNRPADFDLYLGNIFQGTIKEDNTVDDFCGLTCYIVHSRFYEKFLSVEKMNNLDRALAGKGKYVVSTPMICSQYAGYSDNKKKYASYDHLLKNRVLYGENI